MTKKIIEFDTLEVLPDLWEWTSLDKLMIEPKVDIVDGPFGSNLKASEYKDEGIPIARLQNIDRNQFVYKNIRYISYEKANELHRHNFKPGDVLISKLGVPLGKACIAPKKIERGVIVADLVRVHIKNDNINRDYLTYAINSPFIIKQFERHTKGTTRPRVNLVVIRKLPIPVAPPSEQIRIVAEIEKQFSRLDEAVANLKRIKANLKRYKASVLKAAVEGRLTEEWRKANPDVEPADKLLERILVERRKKWEESELAKMKAKEKVPKDDKWKKKYKEYKCQGTEWLYELPGTWCWSNIEQLASQKQYSVSSGPFGSNLGTKDYVESGIPVIRGKNIQDGRILLKDFAYVTQKKAEGIKRSIACPGDIVIIAVGSSGRPGIIPIELDRVILSQNCNKVTCDTSFVLSAFLNWCLQTDFVQEQISGKTTDTVRKFFSLTNFKQIFIPVPPIEEQGLILEIIDEQILNIDRLGAQIDATLKHSDHLRQSILKKAFTGKLVPQINNDESPVLPQKQSA